MLKGGGFTKSIDDFGCESRANSIGFAKLCGGSSTLSDVRQRSLIDRDKHHPIFRGG
jgi:hypothetical protein